jgi:hypothetical protein
VRAIRARGDFSHEPLSPLSERLELLRRARICFTRLGVNEAVDLLVRGQQASLWPVATATGLQILESLNAAYAMNE